MIKKPIINDQQNQIWNKRTLHKEDEREREIVNRREF